MKELMLQMMVAMMPFMKPLVYFGFAAGALGVLLIVVRLLFRSGGANTGIVWAGRILLVLGAFFLACQLAGIWLGAAPGINFGDPRKFEFNIYPFWQIGALFAVVSIVLGFLGGKRGREA